MKFRKMMCAAAAVMLAGCSASESAAAASASESGQTETAGTAGSQPIVIAVTNDMTTMDSSLVTDETSFSMLSLCESGLVQFDENKELAPDLAESWDVSEDGLTYTFHLRDGIVWSDGTPITASDFVYSWRRLVDPDTASEYSYIMESIHVVNAQAVIDGSMDPAELGVEAPDDSTFVVHLDVPCSFLLFCMSNPQFYPLPESFVEAQGDQYALSPDNMLYSGVYTMTGWVTGNSYTFTHNDSYWDAANYPQQEIVISYIQDSQTAMLQYDSGNLDLVTLTGDMIDRYKDEDGYLSTLTSGVWWLAPNMEDADLSNAKLREAISYAVDRQTICESVLKTGAIEADGLIAKDVSAGPDGTDFRKAAGDLTEYDPDKAAECYAEAVKELGHDANVEILYDDTDETSKVAENLQQMIQNACPGITVTLSPKPKKTRIEFMLSHDFSMVLTRWVPDYADPQSYLDIMKTGASMNGGQYSNTEFDELETKATSGEDAADAEARFRDMIEAENILVAQDHGIIPIYQEGGAIMVNPSVKGYLSLVIGTGSYRHMVKEGKKG